MPVFEPPVLEFEPVFEPAFDEVSRPLSLTADPPPVFEPPVLPVMG